MGFFESGKSDERTGVIIDIGSGSVLVAIIVSDINKPSPEVIWSKREHVPLRKVSSAAESRKSVMTSLMNALMALDGEGRKALYEAKRTRKIPFLQVAISAPWSYTTTKTIIYNSEEEFEVTDTLVSELLRTAAKKVEEEMLENEKVHDLGLDIVSKTTMQVVANDYPIIVTGKQKSLTLKVIEASSVAQESIVEAVRDGQSKILPKTELEQYSFMLPFYYVMRDLVNPVTEYCLVDVTYEATELGIVRDGVLSYCTHIPHGAFSIARELSDALKVPLEEAFGYLSSEDIQDFIEGASAAKKEAVQNIFASYQAMVSELFRETGDNLAIPSKIYMHCDLETEQFFNDMLVSAAKSTTRMQHVVFNVTSQLLTKHYTKEERAELQTVSRDTALLISAQFFHTREYHSKFEQL